MSCMTEGNIRCTKCCEAIHIPRSDYIRAKRGKITLVDQESIFKYWIRISKRRAKKINNYLITKRWDDKEYTIMYKKFLSNAYFFKCRALVKNIGCSVHNTEEHPEVCKSYLGGYEYSYTCKQDINIIARSVECN